MWAHRAHCTCGVSLSRHLMNKNKKQNARRNRHVARVTLRSDALTVESNRNKWFEITNRNMHFNLRHFGWCRRLTDFRKTQEKRNERKKESRTAFTERDGDASCQMRNDDETIRRVLVVAANAQTMEFIHFHHLFPFHFGNHPMSELT